MQLHDSMPGVQLKNTKRTILKFNVALRAHAETVRTIRDGAGRGGAGRGAQDGHLDFDTTPELSNFNVALCPQRPQGLLGTGTRSPARPPRLSHSSCRSSVTSMLLYVRRDHKDY